MFLKKLAIGTAAVATLGASAAVFADNYSDAAAVAATKDSGFYITGAAGYSWAGSDKSKTLPASQLLTIKTDSKNGGFAGRLGVGYNLNKYFGLETGFNMYSPAYRQVGPINYVSGPVSIMSSTDRVKTSLYSADVLGKVTLPVGRFFAFVDGGGAYVHAETQKASVNTTAQLAPFAPVASTVVVWNKSSTKGYFRPEAGAGVGYNLTSSLAVDVSYSRIFGTGKITNQNYLASMNTGLVGLTYKF